MTIRDEAEQLHRLFDGQPIQLVTYLASQLATVKTYAQILIGLCGLTITVTGFSGAHMIKSGSIAALTMVAGIALVLIGLLMSLRTVTRLRWVSQELRDDLRETVVVIIERRNSQQRVLAIAAGFVAGGLACYLAAVVVAAVVTGNVDPR